MNARGRVEKTRVPRSLCSFFVICWLSLLRPSGYSQEIPDGNEMLLRDLGAGKIYEPLESPDLPYKSKRLALAKSLGFKSTILAEAESSQKDTKDQNSYATVRIILRKLSDRQRPARIDAMFSTSRGRTARTLKITQDAAVLTIDLNGPYLRRGTRVVTKFSPSGKILSSGKFVEGFSTDLEGFEVMITDKSDRILYFGSWPEAPSLPERVFSDKKGKEIRGRVLAVSDERVKLKIDGKVFGAKIDRFSPLDQRYLRGIASNAAFRKAWINNESDKRSK